MQEDKKKSRVYQTNDNALFSIKNGINRPGQEIEGPMAVAVLGGLVSSTLLNLLVLPALAHRYVRISSPGIDSSLQ